MSDICEFISDGLCIISLFFSFLVRLVLFSFALIFFVKFMHTHTHTPIKYIRAILIIHTRPRGVYFVTLSRFCQPADDNGSPRDYCRFNAAVAVRVSNIPVNRRAQNGSNVRCVVFLIAIIIILRAHNNIVIFMRVLYY